LRVIIFGSNGILSSLPFSALINSKHTVVAYVSPTSVTQDKRFNVLVIDGKNKTENLAYENNIKILRFNNFDNSLGSELKALNPDVIVVSCFAYKIPESILSYAKLGCINLHPSLLPKFRGADPIFWQVQQGLSEFGASIRIVTDDWDAGPIICQENLIIHENWNRESLIQNHAILLTKLMINTLNDFENSLAQARPQSENKATYFSFPRPKDYELDLSWSASRINQFVKFTEGRVLFYPLKIQGQTYRISRILSYDASRTSTVIVKNNIVNENGLSTADVNSVEVIEKHMIGFFFQEGDYGQLPAGFQSGGGGKK